MNSGSPLRKRVASSEPQKEDCGPIKKAKYGELFPGLAGTIEELALKTIYIQNRELYSSERARSDQIKSLNSFLLGIQKEIQSNNLKLEFFFNKFVDILDEMIKPFKHIEEDDSDFTSNILTKLVGYNFTQVFANVMEKKAQFLKTLSHLVNRAIGKIEKISGDSQVNGKDSLPCRDSNSELNLIKIYSSLLQSKKEISSNQSLFRKFERGLVFVQDEILQVELDLKEIEKRNSELLTRIEDISQLKVEEKPAASVAPEVANSETLTNNSPEISLWEKDFREKENIVKKLRQEKVELVTRLLNPKDYNFSEVFNSPEIAELRVRYESDKAENDKLDNDYKQLVISQRAELNKLNKNYKKLQLKSDRQIRDLITSLEQTTEKWKRIEQECYQINQDLQWFRETKDYFRSLLDLSEKEIALQKITLEILTERLNLIDLPPKLKSLLEESYKFWNDQMEKRKNEYSQKSFYNKYSHSTDPKKLNETGLNPFNLNKNLISSQNNLLGNASQNLLINGAPLINHNRNPSGTYASSNEKNNILETLQIDPIVVIPNSKSFESKLSPIELYLNSSPEALKEDLEKQCLDLEKQLDDYCGSDAEKKRLLELQARVIHIDSLISKEKEREVILTNIINEKYTNESELQGEIKRYFEKILKNLQENLKSKVEMASQLRINSNKQNLKSKIPDLGLDQLQEKFDNLHQVNISSEKQYEQLELKAYELEDKYYSKKRQFLSITLNITSKIKTILTLEALEKITRSLSLEGKQQLEQIGQNLKTAISLLKNQDRKLDTNETILENYRRCYNCSLCSRARSVDSVLVGCGHVFCQECIDDKCIKNRNRRCPRCNQKFDKSDVISLGFA